MRAAIALHLVDGSPARQRLADVHQQRLLDRGEVLVDRVETRIVTKDPVTPFRVAKLHADVLPHLAPARTGREVGIKLRDARLRPPG